jgi:DNA mismatch repair protein MutS
MMRQYHDAKKTCGDALLFFRMGDFYELFLSDAEKAAEILGLTLTSRDKSNAVPMAGFPHHQLDSYIAKLIKLGHRVAVCEQVEDPKTAKGLVKREIAKIVTPGTVIDQALLNPAESNFLAAICPSQFCDRKNQKEVGIAWADISTGQFFTTAVPQAQLPDLIDRIGASEILVPDKFAAVADFAADAAMITDRPKWSFQFKNALDVLKTQLAVSTLEGFGVDQFGDWATCAAAAIISYLKETQKSALGHFNHLHVWRQSQFVEIDSATWRSLEVNRTIRGGVREGSLLGVIDRCKTPMGSRLLNEWFANPLADKSAIDQRLDAVAEFVAAEELRSALNAKFKKIFDLQRLVARVATGRPSPRDLSCVAKTLAMVPSIKAKLTGRKSQSLMQLETELDPCGDLRIELEKAIVDPCPANIKDGNFIQDGYDQKLDGLRELAAGGKQWIANYQQKICDQTGIPSLKVGFNKVFGYYLECTHAHRDKVPDDFIRKQTLKNAERFITPELKEYEEKVLSADAEANAREQSLFNELRELARAHTARLKSNAQIIATLDAFCGLAQLAVEQNYCRPEIVTDGPLFIDQGRHPVLDIVQPTGAFVPNDTKIDEEFGYLHLITGPNMAGKSTYIRQTALIALMAQVGSFVPAASAKVGIVDKIFARVGASDELSKGQSTFMVEMTETARILNTATNRSLVILDEIGRGTSTYDGVSLAWAIVEYLHDQIGCRTLFATHYHELTSLENEFKGVCNYNVAVREWDEKIVFLHKIVAGSADKSYGIHVARLAGVPDWVNRRAESILDRLENKNDVQQNSAAIQSGSGGGKTEIQMTMFGVTDHPLIEKIRKLDPNQLTPMNALEMVNKWKEEVGESAEA